MGATADIQCIGETLDNMDGCLNEVSWMDFEPERDEVIDFNTDGVLCIYLVECDCGGDDDVHAPECPVARHRYEHGYE